MLRHFLLVASLLTVTGILFPILSLISGADRTLLEDSSIVTWETYQVQPVINERLTSAYLPKDGSEPTIPTIIPEWYSLHYFTLCSGTFIWSTDTTTTPSTSIKSKNATSTHCTSRWFNQSTNLTQILLYAAMKGLSDPNNFPPELWNETAIEDMTNNIASIVVLEYPYDSSPIYPAVATLFTGFAFAIFSTPLILSATFVAVTHRSMFRILPHAAMAFAALGAIFLTASAGLESSMASLFSGTTPGDPKINASSSPIFQGFQWTGAVGMWVVVFLVWLGGIWGQKVILVNSRYREKQLASA
ncbi:MAG: hypothetical protein GOMPHAMPRED_005596 [Gomphillus americanus]|uniref:Uncharacterized protein n=1 Tax=Gomphillus americanus TaxID=1940652 RepID=A0A8H3IWU6_9LECA|nr:MAG: hypothetical protein GOMPHAMPRED_005596 [Gomphillus americanus]